jgi:hypothetical protein
MMKVFSFGGGVQSMAVLVLAAQGRVDYDAFVFANVGDDSENPETIEYVNRHAIPYASAHGIRFDVAQKTRKGEPDTVLKALERDNKSVVIPVYMSNGAPGNRSCTFDHKVKVVDEWIKLQGVSSAVIGVGISTDESKRMRSTESQTYYRKGKPIGFAKSIEYPLIDLQLSRSACAVIIQAAGLPVPPKSSCWFCPFHHPSVWIELKRTQPDLWQRALTLESRINEKRRQIGRDEVYLHQRCQPLEIAVADQLSLFETSCNNQCDSGYCFT